MACGVGQSLSSTPMNVIRRCLYPFTTTFRVDGSRNMKTGIYGLPFVTERSVHIYCGWAQTDTTAAHGTDTYVRSHTDACQKANHVRNPVS